MAGETTTASLQDAMLQMRQSARIQREFSTGFGATCDRQTLGKGEGDTWNEVVLGKLTAQSLGQTQRLDNPQEITDTLFSIEPETIGVHVILTRKMQDRIARNVFGQVGGLLQNAMDRRMHLDGLAMYDGATFTNPGHGNTLTSGTLQALVAQIYGNTTEQAAEDDSVYAWLHPYQTYDLMSEIGAPVGTYVIEPGPSQDAYLKGTKAVTMVASAEVHNNGNVRIDSSTDAHGGVHAKKGIVLVEEEVPRSFAKDLEDMDGARALWLYASYAYGQRSSGTLFGRVLSDATAPTS